MRADGIGFQSLFGGLLNSDCKRERIPVCFEYVGARASLKPILQSKVAYVFYQHRPVGPGNRQHGGNRKTGSRKQISHLDVSAGIIGERQPRGWIGGFGFAQPVGGSLVLVERLAVNHDYYTCLWHACAEI